MGKIRILHLRSCEGFYGAENIIYQVSKALGENGKYLPIVGIFSNQQNTHLQFAEFLENQSMRSVTFDCNGPLDLRTVRKIKNYIKREKISILHSHGYKANFYAFLANLGTPVYHVCTCYPWNDESYSLRGKFYAWIDKRQIRWLDHIITDAELTREEILKLNISPDKVTNIDNGIDFSRFDQRIDKSIVRRSLGIPADKVVIGAVGRFTAEKGHSILVKSATIVMKEFSNVYFLIVGDGELKDKLRRQVQRAGHEEDFNFAGVRKDIPEMLGAMDIFVLPSFSEGMPMSLLEAMAAGKAIVATRVGSVPRIVKNGETGRVVDANEHDLAKAIGQYLQDSSSMARFGKAARQFATGNYSSQIMAERYAGIYTRLSRKSVIQSKKNYSHLMKIMSVVKRK